MATSFADAYIKMCQILKLKARLWRLQIPIGAEAVGVGADDLEELEEDDDDYIRLGHEDEHEADFSKLQLKPDHQNRQAVCLSAAAAALTSNLQLVWTPSMSHLL